jgi:PAS domain S-box-containing protein
MDKPSPSKASAGGTAIFVTDAQWKITSINPETEQLTGLTAEELIGKNGHEIFCSNKDFAALAELCKPVQEGQVISNHPIPICTDSSRKKRLVMASIIPLPGSDGRTVNGAIICLQDTGDQALIHQLALDSVADGVFTVDESWKITSFNKAAEQLTGWTAEEVIGKACASIFHSSLCGKACLLADAMDKSTSLVNRSIFIQRKDGTAMPVSVSASPLYNYFGEVIGGVETFRDNSESLRNDLILKSVADGVFTVDRDWKITSFNRAAEKITGWTAEEVIGKGCGEIFHSSVCGEACVLKNSIDTHEPNIDRTIFIKAKAGHFIPVSISASPLLDDQGNVIGGIETFRDNTRSIRRTLILDSIADGVFTVDRNWQITSFNRAAEEITGWSRDEAIGKSCSEIFHSSICGKNCAIAESLYSGGPVSNRSITILNHRGEKIPISISAAPLTDHEGNIIGGVETFRDLTAITTLRKQLSQKFTFDEIISKSVAMQRLFKIMPEIARSPSTVLVLGESGTGKELVARALYNASERSDKPFIIVNCGALPETLLESELFGYKAGAFTDARKDREGRFAAAEGGTLFLDEIGDIPQSVQVKLLRVLQEKVYEPLGSNTPVKADVRIITATNRDLQALVAEGTFREDLFYRLNVVKIQLPPLRERKEDLPLLIDHFIKKYSAQQGKDIVGISAAALAILMRYDFPGNIRELENIIEYSFILCEGGYIQPEHLPDPFAPDDDGVLLPGVPMGSISNKPQSLEEIEKQAISLALERNKWRKMATCRELGVSKDTLRRKIKKYQLQNPLERDLSEH